MILDRFRLDDQVAIVTGAGRGIGRGVALALCEAGAHVVLAARRASDLEDVARAVRERGRRALVVPTDVTDGKQLDRLLEATLAEHARLDILVNNAGGWPPLMALAVSDADLTAALHFNVTATFHLSRAAAPHLAASAHGCIVNISSAMSHLVDSGFVAYGTAKAALDHMTRLLAHEWAPRVRVNAVAAGATLTDALEFVCGDPATKKQMEQMTPLGRLGATEDIAAAVLYLASPAASWISGKILEVDGGTIATNWPYKIPGGL